MDASAIVAAAAGTDLLEELIDSLEIGVLLQDRHGNALLSNPAARRILGLTEDQLKGHDPIDPRWTILHADGRPLPRDERPGRTALRTGRPYRENLLGVRHPDGRVTWVSSSAQPHGDAAAISVTDVTAARTAASALRATTSRLENLVENLHGGVMVEDEQRRVLLVNAEMLAIFDVTDPPESRAGTSSAEGVRSIAHLLADPEGFVERYEQVVAAGVPVRGEEIVLADGRTFERDYIPVSAGRAAGGHMWLYRDVSRRKGEEREAARLRDEAIRAARLKTEFLTTMSHEIRTPINGVLATVELLLDTALEAHQRELAKLVREASAGLLTVVDDALDLSRIEAEKLEPRVVDLDVAAVVETVGDVVLSAARRKGLALSVYADPRIPPRLRGDAQWLRQVLVNLAGNAVKFTPAGELRVSARLVGQDGGSTVVRFSVSDTGAGIPWNARERVFEPFVQLDEDRAEQHTGTGLGLAICRRLVRLMGGELDVESGPGRGSTFSFSIALGMGSPRGRHDGPRGLRVLVAEPSDVHASIAADYLAAWGVEAERAASGEAALERAAEAARTGHPFQVALLGTGPPSSAAALAAELRALDGYEELAVVLLKDVGAPAAGPAASFAHELTRPLKQSQLYEAVVGAAEPAPTELLTGLHVLVAEDDVVSREMMVRQLAKLGVRAHAVATGQQAVDALAAHGYDAVLMDLHMPLVDGLDAARAIRALPGPRASVPIIAVTGDEEPACDATALDGFVRKPASSLDLAAALARARPGSAIDRGAIARLQDDLGDPAELRRIAGIYLEQLHAAAATIAAAAESSDREALRRATHRLGSASATFGAGEVAELCRRMELLERPDAALAAALAIAAVRADAALRALLHAAP